MIQTVFSPPGEIPVNAMRSFRFDQFARVAETGNGLTASFRGSPPPTGTRSSSQVPFTRRLNRIRLPSGENHGQKSWLPSVRNRTCEAATGQETAVGSD